MMKRPRFDTHPPAARASPASVDGRIGGGPAVSNCRRSRVEERPMWHRGGPCFTSMVECWRVPGTVMIPRDFDELHPCNLTLQRQNGGRDDTGEH